MPERSVPQPDSRADQLSGLFVLAHPFFFFTAVILTGRGRFHCAPSGYALRLFCSRLLLLSLGNPSPSLSRTADQGLACERPVHRLLFPPSAERSVKLHQTLILRPPRVREREFGGKKRALAIQHFEVSRSTSLVAHVGEAHRFLQVCDSVLLAKPDLVEFLITDQRIGDVSESLLNRLPVSDQRLLMLRLRRTQISTQSSSGEDRLGDLCRVKPDSQLRVHEPRECAASSEGAAAGTCQRDLGKELRLGDSDFRVGSD